MKKYVIDTNALISFVTDRNLQQQEKVAAIFEAATHQKCNVICPENVLAEFVYVMDRVYKVDRNEISRLLREFIAMPGVETAAVPDFSRLFRLWPSSIPDFGDAVVAAIAQSVRGSVVFTLDERFRALLLKTGLQISPTS